MSELTGSEAQYLTWKISKSPATSPVFSFNDFKWHLDLIKGYSDYSLDLVSASVSESSKFWPFQVTCFAKYDGMPNGLGFMVTDCKAFSSSYHIWRDTFRPHQQNTWSSSSCTVPVKSLQEMNTEFIVIFHREVAFTVAVKPTGDVLNLDLNTSSRLSSDLENLLASGDASDVQLKCKGGTRFAHWSVLVARSEVFSAMFRNEMSEKRSGVVNVKDVDASTMDLFLEYVYTGKMPDVSEGSLRDLYVMADKYEVRFLKRLCLDSMVGSMDADNFQTVLTYAHGRGDVELTDAATARILDHPGWLNCETWFQFSKEHSWLANEVYRKFYDKVYFRKE